MTMQSHRTVAQPADPFAKMLAPIIIIGAGRSGTSLLDQVLNAHPDITMFGEFNFTIATLWRQFWDSQAASAERDRRAATHIAASGIALTDAEIVASVFRFVRENERGRTAQIIRDAVNALYEIDRRPKPRWGFKEIWMPTTDANAWDTYDWVFPGAQYVHIVRHPYEFARSVADWHRQAFTIGHLSESLPKWIDYHAANVLRASTGRYHAIRYEDLIANPEATLAPVLQRIGLAWHADCAEPFARAIKPSGLDSPLPPGGGDLMDRIPGLSETMAGLGYTRPAPPPSRTEATPVAAVTRLTDRSWLLAPPYLNDGGLAWMSKLYTCDELSAVKDQADDLDSPMRSRLALFEDGVPLGPAHSLHALIRSKGGGLYSHWHAHHALRFSALDNSDPNTNQREYVIRIMDQPLPLDHPGPCHP